MQSVSGAVQPDGVSINIDSTGKIFASGYKEIKMTSGTVAEIATEWPGWQLCDGTNGTPDLRDRFVIAAGGAYNPGATGDGSIPVHEHSIARRQTATGAVGGDVAAPTDTIYTKTKSSDANTAWANDPNSPANIKAASYGTGTKVIATYYALCFIQKV